MANDKGANWLVQQLRVSLFPSLEEKFDSQQDIWPQVKGAEKEKMTIDSKTGAVLSEGWFNTHKLILSVSPVKIDLIMMVPAPAHIEEKGPVIEHLGGFTDSLKEFYPVVEDWLKSKSLPAIIRLAFGANLVMVESSRDDSYQTLSRYLPFDLDSNKMSDFNLQLNLLTKSKLIKDLSLNRLSKWNSAKLTPELAIVGNPKATHKYPSINLSLVELDINTNQDNKENLNRETLLNLYSELVSLGIDLSRKGVVDNAN